MNKQTLNDMVHSWPPNIHRYEQTYFGISVMSFMVGGVLGILSFVIISQLLAGIFGMILGAILGIVTFALAVFCTTRLPIFHHMTLPIYLLTRFQKRNDTHLELPLIISSQTNTKVILEDWDGTETGTIE